MRDDEEKPDTLSVEYASDLNTLRGMDVLIITEDVDMPKLRILCRKYGLKVDVTKRNFADIVGRLSGIIFDRLEAWNYELADRIRERSPAKKQPGEVKQKVPRELE